MTTGGKGMAKDLARIAKEREIKYFLISFVDLFGVVRAKLVPARAIGEMQKDGAGSIPMTFDHTLKGRKEWEEIFLPRLQYSKNRIDGA